MRTISRSWAGLVLALGLGGAACGCGASGFACESDISCAGLPEGACEADGFCSVPDGDCRSGRRYAPYSGGLSDRCVGEGASETGLGSSSTQGSSASTSGLDSLDDSTTRVDPSGADSTAEIPTVTPCRGAGLIVDEPFDSDLQDPDVWDVSDDPGIVVSVSGGELRFDAQDAEKEQSELRSAFDFPPVGSASVELTLAPEGGIPGEAYFVLEEFGTAYGFVVSEGLLQMFYSTDLSRGLASSTPYDPLEHRWLRLVFDQDAALVAWETSSDSVQWERASEEVLEPGFDVADARIDLGASALEGPLSIEPLVTFGRAFVCEGLED